MRKPAIGIQNYNEGVTIEETIHAIKKAGFRDVYVQWYDEKKWEIRQKEQVKLCKELGLNILFAHISYKDITNLWKEGQEGDKALKRIKKNLGEAKLHHIPMIVMHLERGDEELSNREVGFQRLKLIEQYARRMNLLIAFENTKDTKILADAYWFARDYNTGLCFDSGHYHTFSNEEDFPFYIGQSRTLAINFHDNDGTEDSHLLPFDGTIKWRPITEKLKLLKYRGPVTMNPVYRGEYLNKLTLDQFYLEAFKRGQKIAEIFGDENYDLDERN